jgi:hypothetical protein
MGPAVPEAAAPPRRPGRMSAPMSFPEPVRRGDTSHCGACTVVLDGASVKSWTLLAAQADGAR